MDEYSYRIDNKYIINKMIGIGYTSKVVLATNQETNQEVAIKIY